jgi:hypothetical protein
MTKKTQRLILAVPIAATLMGAAGCDRQMRFSPVDMWNRSRYKPLEPEPFFADGSSTRPQVPGTVARGELRIDEVMYAGRRAGTGTAPLTSTGGGNSMDPTTGNGGSAGGRTTVSVNGNRVLGGGNGVDRAVGDNLLGDDPTLATNFPFPITKDILVQGEEQFNVFCSPCHSRAGDGRGMIVERGFSAPPSFHIDRLRNAPVGHYFDVITHGYGAMYSYASRIEPRDRWAIIAYIRLMQAQRVKSGDREPQYDTPRTPLTRAQGGTAPERGSSSGGKGMTQPSATRPSGMNRDDVRQPAIVPGGRADGALGMPNRTLNSSPTKANTSDMRSQNRAWSGTTGDSQAAAGKGTTR